MRYFKEKYWLFPVIGAFIALISLFTPTTYDISPPDLILIWINQFAVRVNQISGVLTIELLRSILWLNITSILCEITIFSSAIFLITITNFYRKTFRKYHEIKWNWIISAILIAMATLTWIISMEIAYINSPQSHWEWYSPHFGVIGPFIGVGIIIIGGFLAKDAGERNQTKKAAILKGSKNIPFFLIIIGGLLTLISLFTPTTYNYRFGTDLYYVWINHLALDVETIPLELYLLTSRADIFLVCFSIVLAGILLGSVVVLFSLTTSYKKASITFQKLRWKWLTIAIIISLSTLVWIILMEIFYAFQGGSHWLNYRPHFGVIGPFIGSSLIMVAFFLIKINNKIDC